MKDYELTILIHPDLEMNLDPVLTKIKSLIESNQGVIVKEETDGKKRLAYRIKGQDYAVYYFYTLQLPAEAPNKLASTMNIMDEILRSQLVKVDPRKAKYEAILKERAAAEPSEDDAAAEAESAGEEA